MRSLFVSFVAFQFGITNERAKLFGVVVDVVASVLPPVFRDGPLTAQCRYLVATRDPVLEIGQVGMFPSMRWRPLTKDGIIGCTLGHECSEWHFKL